MVEQLTPALPPAPSSTMPRTRLPLMLRGLVLPVLLAASASACDDGPGGEAPADPPGPRAQVLEHVGASVLLPLYREFASRAAALRDATAALVDAPDDPAARTAAQNAWTDAIAVWQRAEMIQIGPAGPAGASGTPGGAGLRSDLYAWPLLRLCAVDEATASDLHGDTAAVAASAPSQRGLGALEYLLFVDTSDNQCSALSGINTDGTWEGLVSAGELPARRARQAAAIADVLASAADALRERWEPSGGDFVRETREPRRPGAIYGSAQAGLNALSDALLKYLDLDVEDDKLGTPAGLTADCAATTCPELRESRFANRSKEHVANNLVGFETAFFGGAPGGPEPGFDDVLVAVGAGDLATSVTTELAAARQAVDAIPGSLVDALGADPSAVVAAHTAVSRLRVVFETAVLSALDLEPPQDIAADND